MAIRSRNGCHKKRDGDDERDSPPSDGHVARKDSRNSNHTHIGEQGLPRRHVRPIHQTAFYTSSHFPRSVTRHLNANLWSILVEPLQQRAGLAYLLTRHIAAALAVTQDLTGDGLGVLLVGS